MKKLNALNLGKSLGRNEMRTINGGLKRSCTATGGHKWLYSPEGNPVSEACEYNCGGTIMWGGCGFPV